MVPTPALRSICLPALPDEARADGDAMRTSRRDQAAAGEPAAARADEVAEGRPSWFVMHPNPPSEMCNGVEAPPAPPMATRAAT
jgi:hypothetical protein